jgi:hypothetical protein
MFMVIQFYIQLRNDLAEYRPFLKVLAIKLVIFLSFWQSFMISILTSSTLKIVEPTAKIAYPDLKVGIPSLLLCIEMAIFSILHLFAFPYKPYSSGVVHGTYPTPDGPKMNELGVKQGGFMGLKALGDAMNPWDLVKGFARGMRWLFVGRKNRENDTSYKATSFDINNPGNENDMTLGPTGRADTAYKGSSSLPIAEEFRQSRFGMPNATHQDEERAGLVAHAQQNPLNSISSGGSGYVPARQRYDANGQDISHGGTAYDNPYDPDPDSLVGRNPTPGTVRRHQEDQQIGVAIGEPEPYHSRVPQDPYLKSPGETYYEQKREERGRRQPTPSEQWRNATQRRDETPPEAQGAHHALWGPGAGRTRDEGGQF